MRVATDDEVYRVDAVWLGPDEITLPFRASYVAWGVGLVTWLGVFSIVRASGVAVGVFSIAWSIVAAVVLTRAVMRLISHERPLSAVLMLLAAEITAPTRLPGGWTWQPNAFRLRVRTHTTTARPPTTPARTVTAATVTPAPRQTASSAPSPDEHATARLRVPAAPAPVSDTEKAMWGN